MATALKRVESVLREWTKKINLCCHDVLQGEFFGGLRERFLLKWSHSCRNKNTGLTRI